jgi:DNA repair exonuclease SbcCD ATPase subunit
MKCIRIILIEYKRLVLNNIRWIDYNPSKPIQLILGTNGSGKTSLMRELTPLPAERNNYNVGGSKKIFYEKDKIIYELTSDFTSGQKHSFIMDGEELNTGGTITVQYELVKKYFNYTTEIRELITNQKGFHSMSAMERRSWITRLSNTDYSYALKLYQKLKEKTRDYSGSVKLLSKRLVTERASTTTLAEKNQLKNQVDEIRKSLDFIYQYRKTDDINIDDSLSQVQSLKYQLAQHQDKVSDAYNTIQNINISLNIIDPNDLEHLITQAKINKSNLMLRYNDVIENKMKVDEKVQKTNVEDYHSLAEQEARLSIINELIEKETIKVIDYINEFSLNIPADYYISKSLDTFNLFQSIKDPLISILNRLPTNSDDNGNLIYSREKVAQSKELLANCNDSLRRNENILSNNYHVKKSQEAKKNHDATSCPNCNHHWFIGYDEKLYLNNEKNIIEVEQQISNLHKQIKGIEFYLESANEYFSIYKQFLSIKATYPEKLNLLWQLLDNSNVILLQPKTAAQHTQMFGTMLELSVQINNYTIEKKELVKIIESKKSFNVDENNKLLIESKHLDELIEKYLNNINLIEQKIIDLELLNKSFMKINESVQAISSIENQLNVLNEDLTNHYKTKEWTSIISSLQTQLVRKESILNSIENQFHLIADLEKQIEEQTLNHQACQCLTNAVSPNEGLIAKSLMSFINYLINRVNEFIEKIWTYPLRIEPCHIVEGDEIDLDYKFELHFMTSDGSNESVKDISLGSSAMQEVIDLAFRIVAMDQLGLGDSPIMLDEFGKGFDSQHRINASQVIQSLMLEKAFPQLFIISHHEQTYGGMANAQVLVLSDANIVIPNNAGIINEHVKFK